MKSLTTLVITLLALPLFGQDYLSFTFNATASGRNVAVAYSTTFKSKHELGGALRFNINSEKHPDNQDHVFLNRLFATELTHYFGLQTYYRRNIVEKWHCIKPYLFYDLQSSYSTTFNRMVLPYTYDFNGDVLYKEYLRNYGPFLWIEQNIGMGFKVNIAKSFYLFQNIGGGVMFILGKEEKLPITYDKFEWEFGYLLSVGVAYRIND
jgi:hypothetical protein